MTRDEEFELALAQRDELDRDQRDGKHFERLVDLFDTKGAAWINRHLDEVRATFPRGFFARHVRFENYGTRYQRLRLRCDLPEEARP